MQPRNIPADINVEVLLDYFPEGSFKVELKGLHKRNTYNDVLEIEERTDGTLLVEVGRNSIYNALPEYVFHKIDRFSNLPHLEEKEFFEKELEEQKQEIENAYRFFAPIDVQLLLYRREVRRKLRPFTETNSILQDILGDRLTQEQRQNRFIRQAISFLPLCKHIRGNKTLLTMFLRKVFMDEGLRVDVKNRPTVYRDSQPRYIDGLNDTLNDTYVGNVFDELITTFDILFWPEVVDDQFLSLVEEIEVFRLFIQDYFMSIEEQLHFNISHDDPALRLSDDVIYNYLDYNTNI